MTITFRLRAVFSQLHLKNSRTEESNSTKGSPTKNRITSYARKLSYHQAMEIKEELIWIGDGARPIMEGDGIMKLETNVEGSFFVTSACIDCDQCRQLAPETFSEVSGYSAVLLFYL